MTIHKSKNKYRKTQKKYYKNFLQPFGYFMLGKLHFNLSNLNQSLSSPIAISPISPMPIVHTPIQHPIQPFPSSIPKISLKQSNFSTITPVMPPSTSFSFFTKPVIKSSNNKIKSSESSKELKHSNKNKK